MRSPHSLSPKLIPPMTTLADAITAARVSIVEAPRDSRPSYHLRAKEFTPVKISRASKSAEFKLFDQCVIGDFRFLVIEVSVRPYARYGEFTYTLDVRACALIAPSANALSTN